MSAPPRASRAASSWACTSISPKARRSAPTWPASGRRCRHSPRLIVWHTLGRLPRAALASELRAQRDAFTAAVGQPPDFIDGHQHVHHLPGVRDLVLDALATGPQRRPTAVRNTGHVVGPGHGWKRMLIERTGGARLQAARARASPQPRAARRLRLSRRRLSPPRARLARRRRRAAASCSATRTTAGERRDDAIAEARRREAAYLASAAFADDLAEAGVTVGPAWPRSSSAG